VNGIYSKFPFYVQMILGNGLAAGTITAVLLNIAFNYNAASDKPAPVAEPATSVDATPA
jgi:xanthine/uracil permease